MIVHILYAIQVLLTELPRGCQGDRLQNVIGDLIGRCYSVNNTASWVLLKLFSLYKLKSNYEPYATKYKYDDNIWQYVHTLILAGHFMTIIAGDIQALM